jgi:hypothetical protein
MDKKFEDYNITELKALAYDEMAKIEAAQNNMRVINARIVELNKQQSVIQNTPDEVKKI